MAEQSQEPNMAPSASKSIRTYLGLARRYGLFTLLVVVVALAATFLLTQRQEKVYSASSHVLLRTNQTVALFPFARTGPNDLLRVPGTEVIYTQSALFIGPASQGTPAGVSVTSRASANEIVFTARGTVPADVAQAANVWADTYVAERQILFEIGTSSGIEELSASIDGLTTQRDELRADAIEIERLIELANDPQVIAALLAQKATIDALLQPQLVPIDRELATAANDLAELERVARFFGGGDASARVVRTASVPRTPSSPNLLRNLIVGGFLGLALGVFLPTVRELLNEKVDDEDDVIESTSLPILASIPTYKLAHSNSIQVLDHTLSEATERYQALLTGIEFASIGEPVRSIFFTSATPGDGKTTTALNVAALGAKYMNVLLIDGDLRRPNVHERVGAPNATGLADVLRGDAEFYDSRFEFENGGTKFDVLTAGPAVGDPALLLRGHAWERLLAELFMYDMVIIDGPPVLAVTDALLLGRSADAQVLITRAGQTTRPQLAEATELLATNGSRSLGVVVNRDRSKRGSRYQYYGSYAPERAESTIG